MTRILVLDDEEAIGQSIGRYLKRKGYHVDVFQHPVQALNVLQKQKFDVVVTDFRMPDIDGLEMIERIRELSPDIRILLMTAYASIGNAVEAMKLGAGEYLAKPFEQDDLLKRIEGLVGPGRAKKLVARSGPELLGRSRVMQELQERIRKVARSQATVLIEGESGTGKELVARMLHSCSVRSEDPFLAVNMAAIPETLMESELFGHRKGSFTGADQDYEGKFLAAKSGTLFLDEIGEMSAQVQAKLLRVLQENQVLPVGSSRPLKSEARIVAATNRNLRERVSEGSFREDLWFRLNVLDIRVPPLRDRKEDIPELALAFVARYGSEDMQIEDSAMQLLMGWDWPGNVRELENVIHRAIVLAEGQIILARDLPEHISGTPPVSETPLQDVAMVALRDGKSLMDIEREIILKALEDADGNKTNAARILKITRRKLYSRLEKHGIDLTEPL